MGYSGSGAMKRSVWIAALALSLGLLANGVQAQVTTWRVAQRPPQPAPTVRGTAQRPGTAALGRPIATSQARTIVSPEPPRPFPLAPRAAATLPQSVTHGVQPIATVPAPGQVIAASLPATASWTGSSAEPAHEPLLPNEVFASDRLHLAKSKPATLPDVGLGPLPQPGNWQSKFPVTPPGFDVTVAPVAPVASVAGFGADLPPTKWYARGEYLLWWTKNDQVPPLVTTGALVNPNNPLDPVNDVVGTLGRPDTRVLFGGDLERNPFSGARFAFGYYLDDCGTKAIEFSGFFLGQQSADYSNSTFANPILTRPFFNTALNFEDVQRVSFPNVVTGSITVRSPSDFWGLEANAICQWCCGCNWRLDPLAGARYLNLRESLGITEQLQLLGDQVDPRLNFSRFTVVDQFITLNEFYGAQVGLEGRWQEDRWTLDGRFKVAFGVTRQSLSTLGFQDVVLANGERRSFQGGLLALTSNSGDFERNRFAVVPELSLSAGYYLTERLRATLGYNFVYWSSVVRPGDQIDRQLNGNQIPNFAAFGITNTNPPPQVLFKDTDFWAQGLTFGLEYRY